MTIIYLSRSSSHRPLTVLLSYFSTCQTSSAAVYVIIPVNDILLTASLSEGSRSLTPNYPRALPSPHTKVKVQHAGLHDFNPFLVTHRLTSSRNYPSGTQHLPQVDSRHLHVPMEGSRLTDISGLTRTKACERSPLWLSGIRHLERKSL